MLLRDSNHFKQCITSFCVLPIWFYQIELSFFDGYLFSKSLIFFLNTHRQNLLAVTFRSGEFSLQFSNLLFLFSVLLFLIGQLST